MNIQKQKHILWLIILVFAASLVAYAQNSEIPQPSQYRMQLVCIADTNPRESILVIGNLGFKSLASLKQFAGSLPSGSILEWSSSCRLRCDAPFLSSSQEIEGFRKFCDEKGIKFVFVPSG